MDEQRDILYVDAAAGDLIHGMKLTGIRRYADMRGWNVVVCSERESRPKPLTKILAKRRPIGCIVESSAAHTDLPPRFFGNLPVVYLDCSRNLYGGEMPKVMHNGEGTTNMAFRELAANNPNSYAVVDYREDRHWPKIRVQIFQSLATAAGKPCPVFRMKREILPMRAARLAEWVAKLPRKCAVFAVNDATAAEVVAACRKCNRRIPSDMTLIGVDNLKTICEENSPRISSIQIDFERAGYKSANMLDAILSHHDMQPADGWFDPLMVVRRESTRGFGRREQRIFHIVELIRREACNGLTVRDAIAGISGSRRLLEMRFREAMGHSILDEIQHVRMEKVYFLLSKTDTPIGAVAAMCGYRSEIALHKYFKSVTGLCMREWRMRNGAGS